MDISDKQELAAAIDDLSAITGVAIDEKVLATYLAGQAPHSVGYEKIVGPQQHLPALAKYMLVAKSYLVQPSIGHFYDIFRAGRVIPLLRRLHLAVQALAHAGVLGLEERLKRLVGTSDFDEFDAVLFELVVAAAYGEAVGFTRIEFVPERPPDKTPELFVHADDGDIFVECKRFDRMTDASVKLRNEARDLGHIVLTTLRERDVSAVVEVAFKGRPSVAQPAAVAGAVFRSLAEVGAVQTVVGARVTARPLTIEPLPNLVLYPSPVYFHDRYGYLPEQWHGVAPAMLAAFAGPSFLDAVQWEAAVLWKIEDETLLWSIKRLGFTRIFEGLEQLQAAGRRTVQHVWAERAVEYGHRQAQLSKLVETLADRAKDRFACIIVNETMANVSVGGRFDFQEHATPIAGREASPEGPLVTMVFIAGEDRQGVGEWGIGVPLPPIDGSEDG